MGDRRFLVAILLVLGVIIGTNVLFPPVMPDPTLAEADSTATAGEVVGEAGPSDELPETAGSEVERPPSPDPQADTIPGAEADPSPAPAVPVRDVVVEGPLYRFTFTNRGARLMSARLLEYPSFQREGSAELVSEDGLPIFGTRILIDGNTLDLRELTFDVSPADGLVLSQGGEPEDLTFRYAAPSGQFSFEVTYRFHPDSYIVEMTGRHTGLDRRATLATDLGSGVAFNELQERDDIAVLAYVTNGDQDGIRATRLTKVDGAAVVNGPFRWAAFKSKYFVTAMLAGDGDDESSSARFGGVLIEEDPGEFQVPLAVTQGFRPDGSFGLRSYLGPQQLARLASLGDELENVNPYGWRFLRPIIRPFSGLITRLLIWMHDRFNLAYGWVLIVFGILMRLVMLVPHTRATKAQLRNMEVQPKLKAIQEKYKNDPERLQKEMMKLYREDGFNPFAGCLPMLLPWPVLIALFFVFQNSIELRGVPFWWLPDLSAADPYYILPIFLGVSMFLLQWIGFRSVKEQSPQVKMMLWFMPLFMMILFMNFASGLNLYYATANVAMLPQQFYISKQRLKAQERGAAKHARETATSSPDRSGSSPPTQASPTAAARARTRKKKSKGARKRR